MEFARQIDDALEGDRLVVPEHWGGIPGQAFGGFLAATALRVAIRASGQARPISLLGRYFRGTPVGRPVAVEVEREHAGRRLESIQVRLRDAERVLCTFAIQLGEGSHAPYSSQNLEPPAPAGAMRPVHELITAAGGDPPAHIRHVGFEGVLDPAAQPPGAVANRWPAAAGELEFAAVMCIDNFVAPATWRAHGEVPGAASAALPSVDIAAWFHDLDAPGGWLDTRTRAVAARSGVATGETRVWSGDRLVATGSSAVMALPFA